MQIKTKISSSHTADSKPVKQEVNGTVILPPLVFLARAFVPAKPSSLILHSKRRLAPNIVEHLSGVPLKGRLFALSTKIKLNRKSLARA